MFWFTRKAYDRGYRDAQARYECLMNDRVHDLTERFSLRCVCGHDPENHEHVDGPCRGTSYRAGPAQPIFYSTTVAFPYPCGCEKYERAGYAPGGRVEWPAERVKLA